MRSVDWPKETERLLLRPGTADDAETLWRYWQLESVTHWLTRAPATFEVFRKQFDGDGLARWLVIEHEGVVIGDLMLRMMDPWSQAEVTEQAHDTQATLGWVLDPAWAGQGFATEAVRELVRICFDDLGLRRVTADCFALNEPSWRLMGRVGIAAGGPHRPRRPPPLRRVARRLRLRAPRRRMAPLRTSRERLRL